MLFISNVAWTILKMVCIRIIVHVERQIRHPIHFGLWEKFLKRILTYLYCTNQNKINIYHSDVQKHVSYEDQTKDSDTLWVCLKND